MVVMPVFRVNASGALLLAPGRSGLSLFRIEDICPRNSNALVRSLAVVGSVGLRWTAESRPEHFTRLLMGH